MQNKLHWAITGQTAAELIYASADATKLFMGLSTWKHAPHGKILKSDVAVAKNYLGEAHVKELNRIVSAYLDLAENRAQRGILMKMADWATFLKCFLELSRCTGNGRTRSLSPTSIALAAHLARSGFVVALVQHPGNNRADDRLAGKAINLENRPRRVRLAIDAAFADEVVGKHLSLGGVAVIGHSMGAADGVEGAIAGAFSWRMAASTRCAFYSTTRG